jgi:hypothetical protein
MQSDLLQSQLLHLLGEVEVVLGFWAFVLIAAMALVAGGWWRVAALPWITPNRASTPNPCLSVW